MSSAGWSQDSRLESLVRYLGSRPCEVSSVRLGRAISGSESICDWSDSGRLCCRDQGIWYLVCSANLRWVVVG